MSISPEDASASLAEASNRAQQVRRADTQLLWMLVCLAVVYVGAAALLSLEPQRAARYSGIAILGLLIGAIVFVVVVGLRIRAYSRVGILVYFGTLIAFNFWNAAVISVSVITRWWAPGQPSYRIGVSDAVSVLPLVVGILILARRRS